MSSLEESDEESFIEQFQAMWYLNEEEARMAQGYYDVDEEVQISSIPTKPDPNELAIVPFGQTLDLVLVDSGTEKVGGVDNDPKPKVDNQEILRLLAEELNEVIKEEVKSVREDERFHILNPIPLNFYVPPEYRHNCTLLNEDKKRKREKALLVGRKCTSFTLSEYCLAFAMDLDKNNNNRCRYSLAERMEGDWQIDRKKRNKGDMHDSTYIFLRSKEKFRSVVEVTNFILHEAYPPKRRNAKKKRKTSVEPEED